LKILFVSSTKSIHDPYQDPSCRYRCYNPAHDLKKMGHEADVCTVLDFNNDYVGWYDLFVFHRPTYDNRTIRALSMISRHNKAALADCDDLIFDVEGASDSPLHLTKGVSEKHVLKLHKKNLKALKLFRHVTVSTYPLKKKIESLHPGAKVEVVNNGLSEEWVNRAASGARSNGKHNKRISYFCGTRSHDHDFEIIQDVLAKFMEANSDVDLHIMGPLEIQKDLFPSNRLKLRDSVPYDELHKHMKKSWVSIAPLKDNQFNECKSGLKFFESAALGLPVVASPIHDMSRFDDGGIIFAHKKHDWAKAFDLLRCEDNYKTISDKVRNYAIKNCMSHEQTAKMVDFIQSFHSPESHKQVSWGRRYNHKNRSVNGLGMLQHIMKKKTNKLMANPRGFFQDSRHSSLRIFGKMI